MTYENLKFLKIWRLFGWLGITGVTWLSYTPSLSHFRAWLVHHDFFKFYIVFILLIVWLFFIQLFDQLSTHLEFFMENFKFLKLWRFLGWLGVIGIIYLSLTPSLADLNFLIVYQDKMEHFLAYGLLAWWFSQIYPARSHLWFGIFFISLGIAIEFLQDLTGRDFEYGDMLADTLGVFSGYGLYRAAKKVRLIWVENLLLKFYR
ncbi:VanZ family protein [Candidatus Nitrosacidococcus sp. I8]|uniref:VanZ family protein n=1 Tax=Candidatus Nitrosacidococcus sp. I8 TaxID=2942908 RepID=UPI002226F5A5|nr:VanZ family protein [Candidatus Nitrosacidococcus sp. I8]CAH9015663.1 hypothetical protein NURINAE_00178 [Candidatus Nitrosacidococcus sp. I8]